MQVPLNAVKEFLSLEQTREELTEAERNGQLSQIRSYLEAVARIPYELSETSRAKLVDEFVQIRQCDSSFTPEDFQVRLTVSLLVWQDVIKAVITVHNQSCTFLHTAGKGLCSQLRRGRAFACLLGASQGVGGQAPGTAEGCLRLGGSLCRK